MTTGANLERARASATMTTAGRSAAVPATNGKGRITGVTAITIRDGLIAIGIRVIAIAKPGMQFTRHVRLPRGAHGASVARSGFSSYRGVSLRISGRSGGGRGGDRHGGLAEELWR